MEKARIERISELTRISRERQLTAAEKEEREALRQEYIASFRRSLEDRLDSTYLVRPDGTKSRLSKKG